jgi:DNA-binding response OmpR family regulator
VIVLTGRDQQLNEQKAFLAGARAYLQKPVDNDELLAVIRAALPNTWPGAALPSEETRPSIHWRESVFIGAD